jgi:hypothetical protein
MRAISARGFQTFNWITRLVRNCAQERVIQYAEALPLNH